MKKITLLIFFNIILFCHVSSQVIKGLILDAHTDESIPYAEIYSTKFGCITDEKGNFELDNHLIENSDTIYIKCLGYEEVKISYSSLYQDSINTFRLRRKSFNIDEAVVFAEKPKRTVKQGFYKKKAIGSYGTTGTIGRQVAIYIDNKKEQKGKIKKIHFYIRKQGNPTDKFRVHIYEAKDKDSPPLKDLLTESLYTNAEKGDEWVSVDLEKYNLDYPTSGFFISLEFLESSTAVIYYNSTGKSVGGNKLNLGMNSEDTNEGYTWFYDYKQNNWEQSLPPFKGAYVGNAMIAVDIMIY